MKLLPKTSLMSVAVGPVCIVAVFLLLALPSSTSAFVVNTHRSSATRTTSSVRLDMTTTPSSISTTTTSSYTVDKSAVERSVQNLKKVLEREYITFFDPMRDEYYSPQVTFVDPMTTLSGVDSYRNNVDMLASRTLLGSILFSDAGINLHSVTGGKVSDDGTQIEDIITRWTLRVTAKVLPWKPTARFSGISVYQVKPTNVDSDEGVVITGQTDYWDSININPKSKYGYETVDKNLAIQDFLGQLKPSGLEAKSAGPEIPYSLLRRGDGYEVRKYPSWCGVQLPYTRRDEGFGSLGAFTRGMNPLAPAIMSVPTDTTNDKTMIWPLTFAPPGDTTAPQPNAAIDKKANEGGQWRTIDVMTVPSSIIAVAELNDVSMGPVVRKADRELRSALERDGLKPKEVGSKEDEGVRFAQYDAVFSMGKRRGECWIELEEGGHPW